ncbi:thioredoxin domain-containing protein 12-like isoform X1 [Schistocerca americana]|uniref:thioredoxin domain-containing protein 12-like isoform X1 n=1 Tax=Schistocerca americana TaxID=7009 RepID=UPI001F4FE45C|nr:thioredoxin domain-containing protein 12-like isoform X1 [Schistocerca americana]
MTACSSKFVVIANCFFLLGIKYVEAKKEQKHPPPIVFPQANDGRGFGPQYQWLDLEKAIEVSRLTQKPIMVIIHKSWCTACSALKPQFAESKEIEELSSNFVMVNVGDDDKVVGSSFAPDGEYIPRIIFMSPDGEVRPEFYNEGGSEAYKYFYSDISNIITTMKKVQRAYKKKLKSKDTTEL